MKTRSSVYFQPLNVTKLLTRGRLNTGIIPECNQMRDIIVKGKRIEVDFAAPCGNYLSRILILLKKCVSAKPHYIGVLNQLHRFFDDISTSRRNYNGTQRYEMQLRLLATNRLYMFYWDSFQKQRYRRKTGAANLEALCLPQNSDKINVKIKSLTN